MSSQPIDLPSNRQSIVRLPEPGQPLTRLNSERGGLAAGRSGDVSRAPVDAHGCLACPHPVVGPAVVGSPTVFINDRPALRVGDRGVHASCCGPNTWLAAAGSATVFFNGQPAHRKSDTSQHCGGIGSLVTGSPNVFIGG